MKRTFRRVRRTRKGSVMVTGGLGKHGLYVYGGAKRGRTSVGASVGTRGRQIYGSHRKERRTVKARYNIDSKRPSLQAKNTRNRGRKR